MVLPEGLRPELMPQHVAVIMDGNGRWAQQRGPPRSVGHLAGIRKLLDMVEICRKWEISVLTVFGFSYDNWVRPKGEVDFIMGLLEKGLQSEMDYFVREGVRVSMIGDLSKLPTWIQKWVAQVEEKTKDNTKFHLIVAVSYSGKYDITKACRSIAQKVKDGLIEVEDVNEELIERELETKCTQSPHPDLLIRTSGELRISNFLLWQLAYTELFFSGAFWPDFGEEDFAAALRSFQQRNRRFGGQELQGSSEK